MGKIDVKNMDLYYSSFHALKNINLEIPEKKITAFIGPSGCGKIFSCYHNFNGKGKRGNAL